MTSNFAFSGSTAKKDDVSTRLKAMNMKNIERQTQKLEVESRRMEERLQELKLTMGKEKEIRQQKGDSHWSSGKKGSLNTHAKEVLATNPDKMKGRLRKVKVLKEEPVIKTQPRPPPQPGTMAYLAQKGSVPRPPKVKGPVCGQCETKGAMVSCIECGEDYCSTCFASFHLRGALKKHRSVPVQSSKSGFKEVSPRQSVGKLKPDSSSVHQTHSSSDEVKDVYISKNQSPSGSAETPLRRSLSRNVHQHKKVEFNINQSALRNSSSPRGITPKVTENQVSLNEGLQPTSGPSLLDGEYDEEANYKSFQEAIQSWRGTKQEKAPEHSSSVGKQAPTSNVGQKNSVWVNPAVTQQGEDVGTSTIPQRATQYEPKFEQTSSMSYAEQLLLKKHRKAELPSVVSPLRMSAFGYFNHRASDDEEAESVNIQANFEALVSTFSPRRETTALTEASESSFSVVELESITSEDMRGLEECDQYTVEEDQPIIDSAADSPGSHSNANNHNSNATGSVWIEEVDENEVILSPVKNSSIASHTPSNKGREHVRKNEENSRMSPQLSSKVSTKSTRPQSRVQSRPQSRVQSRAESRQGNRRPRSVAQKAAEFGPGFITKTPSEGLASVSRLAHDLPTHQYDPNSMGDFFGLLVDRLAGQESQSGRGSSADKVNRNESPVGLQRYKMSNQVYAITPKTWKPENSVQQGSVDFQGVAGFNGDSLIVRDSVGDINDLEGEQDSFTRIDTGWPTPIVAKPTPQTTTETISFTVSNGISTHLHYSTTSSSVESDNLGDTTLRKSQESTLRKSQESILRQSQGSVLRQSQESVLRQSQGSVLRQSQGSALRGSVLRQSQAVVMEGEDSGPYQDEGNKEEEAAEDERTLSRLEWELASNTGRVSVDGTISRMTHDPADNSQSPDSADQSQGVPQVTGQSLDGGLMQSTSGFESLSQSFQDGLGDDETDSQSEGRPYSGGGMFKLRASDLMDDFEEVERQVMQEEVEKLK